MVINFFLHHLGIRIVGCEKEVEMIFNRMNVLLDWSVEMLSDAWVHFIAGLWFDFFMFPFSTAYYLSHTARIRAQRFIYSTINSSHCLVLLMNSFYRTLSLLLPHLWFGRSLSIYNLAFFFRINQKLHRKSENTFFINK